MELMEGMEVWGADVMLLGCGWGWNVEFAKVVFWVCFFVFLRMGVFFPQVCFSFPIKSCIFVNFLRHAVCRRVCLSFVVKNILNNIYFQLN